MVWVRFTALTMFGILSGCTPSKDAQPPKEAAKPAAQPTSVAPPTAAAPKSVAAATEAAPVAPASAVQPGTKAADDADDAGAALDKLKLVLPPPDIKPPYTPAKLAGRWTITGHDEAYVIDLTVKGDGLTGVAWFFDAGLGNDTAEHGSPNEFVLGRSKKTDGMKVLTRITVNPKTGALGGDLGSGQVRREERSVMIDFGRAKDPFFERAFEVQLRPLSAGAFIF